MLAYLIQNFGYILVTGVLVALVAAIILRAVRDRRAGKGGCGCGCDRCAHAPFCHPEPGPRPESPQDGS